MRAVVIAVVCLVVGVGSRAAEARYPVLRKPVIQYAVLPWASTSAQAVLALTKLGAKPTRDVMRRYVANSNHVEHDEREVVTFVVAGWRGRAEFFGGVLTTVGVERRMTAAQVKDEIAALEGRFGAKAEWGARLVTSVGEDGVFVVVYRR